MSAERSPLDRFWPRRRLAAGPRRGARRSLARGRTGLGAERLEDRRVLAVTAGDAFDTATFTPTAGLVGTIAIDAGVFTDAAGNPNRTGSLAGGFTLVA